LVLGILSLPLCCCYGASILPAIGGLITGFMAISQIKADPSFKGRGLAIAGIILSGAGILMGIAFWIFAIIGLAFPGMQSPQSFRSF
jgi:hypothetical protein